MSKKHYSRELSKVLYFETYSWDRYIYNERGEFYVLQALDVSSLKMRELLIDADLYRELRGERGERKGKYLLIGARGSRRVWLDKKRRNKVKICSIYEKSEKTTWYYRLRMRFLTLRLNWFEQPSTMKLPIASQGYYLLLFYDRGLKLYRYRDVSEVLEKLSHCYKATYVLDGDRVIIIAFTRHSVQQIRRRLRQIQQRPLSERTEPENFIL